jgi:hypothetical protein
MARRFENDAKEKKLIITDFIEGEKVHTNPRF